MRLNDLCNSIGGFARWTHADKIRLFAWHLHEHEQKETFAAAHIEDCYESLRMAPPSNIGPFLKAMRNRKPPELLGSSGGLYLEGAVREDFAKKYGQRPVTVYVQKLLADLPSKIAAVGEKVYLEEALICFQHKALRAAIVMTWNMAFDHLCELVFSKHLPAFNAQLPRSFPKADPSAVSKRDDLGELKESQVLQVCKSAGIISGPVHKILKEKLDRRNIAAHPSEVLVPQLTAEEYITDLVENVVLKLS
jgi:hypothetical protein